MHHLPFENGPGAELKFEFAFPFVDQIAVLETNMH
jgi:hypothetical protein